MNNINKTVFKKAMSRYATGVTVISINYEGNYIGKTVNSFNSLSLTPPLILFSLDKKSSSLNKFKKTNYIGINFLSKKQKILSEHFAKKRNTWGNVNSFLSENDIPLIKKSAVNLSCRKIKIAAGGDHMIFICKVIDIKIDKSVKPLMYLDNKYF